MRLPLLERLDIRFTASKRPLNLDLYNGLLFLCLVPSTVQSSIAFTSIARGNVSAALVSASLSNIVGIALTPLLVVLLMHTSGGARMDATAIRDVGLQLLLPFVLGQLMRRWIADWILGHAAVTKVVDRGSILVVVYTAFSMGMVEHIWRSVNAWQLLAVAVDGQKSRTRTRPQAVNDEQIRAAIAQAA